MAGTKGTLKMVDGTEHKLVITAGDRIRSNRKYAKPDADREEKLYFMAFLAAQKADLAPKGDGFDAWLDTVADFDVDLTHEMVDNLVASGQINAEQAEAMYARVVVDQAEPEGEAETKGEAPATSV